MGGDSLHGSSEYSLTELSTVLPRVLIVSRRTLRKNKFVDFVGEYHLDLIVKYGAVPVIVPRVMGLQSLLDSFEPIHGVLLCEGEDIDPSLYEMNDALSAEELEEIKEAHSGDSVIDHAKDSIEFQLAKRCLERNIPYMGICRGSQVLNVACGGALYSDVETELTRKKGIDLKHMDYNNYDGHRHPIRIVKDTPLFDWFKTSLKEKGNGEELLVNSYHHQGVRKLAPRFQPMAFAPDGLIEAFYDPDTYDPDQGKFIVGLQFHPERMRHFHDGTMENDRRPIEEQLMEQVFDYPECPRAYQEFAKSVLAYKRRLTEQKKSARARIQASSTGSRKGSSSRSGGSLELDEVMEQQRKSLVRSFSLAKRVYDEKVSMKKNPSVHNSSAAMEALTLKRTNSNVELEKGAEFLQENTAVGTAVVRRLKAMGATVRNSSLALLQLQNQEPASLTDNVIGSELNTLQNMSAEELKSVLEYHEKMAKAAQELLQMKGCSSVSDV